jgi:hypothetical protein
MTICKKKNYDDCYSTANCFMTNGTKRKPYCRKSLKKQFLCKGQIKALCNGPDCLYTNGPKRFYCKKTRRRK